jgi:hypothetical protein|eukprot:COSAG01_NODE_704_length_14147_cov_5.083648_10_plen_396_part_00
MAEDGKKAKSGADRRRERNAELGGKLQSKQVKEAKADPAVLTGINHLIGRKGVDWNDGVWSDEHGRPTIRMDFCLGSNMVDKLMESRLAKEGDSQQCLNDRADAAALCSRMLDADCFFRVDCRGWNTRLLLSRARRQTFEDSDDAAYIITYEGSKMLRYVIGALIVICFFLACIFPAWPDSAKYVVRDCSRYLLTAMMGVLVPITILRPIVAGVTGWWFLPNLWTEEEFFASFVPTWQAPPKNRDAGSDALVTIIVTVVMFAALYAMLITEVVDPDAPAPDMADEDKDKMFDDLLDKEDVFVPESVKAEAAAEAAAAASADAAADATAPAPAEAQAGAGVDDAPVLPDWGDDEEEEEDPELMAEFLKEKQEEQRKLDKKNPYREDKKRKPIHGGK